MSERRLSAEEAALLEALRGLRFGAVEATVHDGRIVRIERREKLRLGTDPETGGPQALDPLPASRRPQRRSLAAPDRGETP